MAEQPEAVCYSYLTLNRQAVEEDVRLVTVFDRSGARLVNKHSCTRLCAVFDLISEILKATMSARLGHFKKYLCGSILSDSAPSNDVKSVFDRTVSDAHQDEYPTDQCLKLCRLLLHALILNEW